MSGWYLLGASLNIIPLGLSFMFNHPAAKFAAFFGGYAVIFSVLHYMGGA